MKIMLFFSKISKLIKSKTVFWILLVMSLGGIGGVLFDRSFFPYLSTKPVFRNIDLIKTQAPMVITRREEIRINEGINYTEVINRAKENQVLIYAYEGPSSSNENTITIPVSALFGTIVTSDGVIVAPRLDLPRNPSFRVLLADGRSYPATLYAQDSFSGLAFFRIAEQNLPVAKQSLSREMTPGERLVAVSLSEQGSEVKTLPLTVIRNVRPEPSFIKIYEIGDIESSIQTSPDVSESHLGMAVVNRDAQMVGLVTKTDQGAVILRSEDLNMVIDTLLTTSEIVWPTANIRYQILGPSQTRLLGFSQASGVLLRSNYGRLRVNDFIYEIGNREITSNFSFQDAVYSFPAGESVLLKLIRAGELIELEVEFR